jgi:hypothetical protein
MDYMLATTGHAKYNWVDINDSLLCQGVTVYKRHFNSFPLLRSNLCTQSFFIHSFVYIFIYFKKQHEKGFKNRLVG